MHFSSHLLPKLRRPFFILNGLALDVILVVTDLFSVESLTFCLSSGANICWRALTTELAGPDHEPISLLLPLLLIVWTASAREAVRRKEGSATARGVVPRRRGPTSLLIPCEGNNFQLSGALSPVIDPTGLSSYDYDRW